MRTKIILVLSSCFFAIDALANGCVRTTDDSMFAVWMVQFLAAVFVLVAAGCFLRERGINAFSKIRDLLRQPILVLTFLCMFVGTSIQYAVSKVSPLSQIENGELRIENSEPMRSGNLQLPIFPSFPIVPNSQFSILNSQFTYINPQSNSVILGIGWPMANPPPEEVLDIYSTSNLVSGAWEAIGSAAAPSNAPGVEVEVPHSALVGGETNIAFFAMGLRVDSDGDGLTDSYERLVSRTDPAFADTDRDGVSDGTELASGSAPLVRDSDGDGLVDGSDPSPLAVTPLDDLDGDGIPDAYEEHWFGSTNAVDDLLPPSDGFSLEARMACGIAPEAPPPDMERPAPPFAVWKISDPFLAENTSLAGDVVYERAFPIGRTSTWQQYFISAAPTNAAAWSLDGAALETCGQSYTSSPADDSLRLQLPSSQMDELVVRVHATAATFGSRTPLYLIAYAPALSISNAVSGAQGGRRAYASAQPAADETGRRVFHAEIDRSARPCAEAPLGEELSAVPPMSDPGVSYNPAAETLTVPGPGVFALGTSPVFAAPMRGAGGNDPGDDAFAAVKPSGAFKGGCAYCGKSLDWNQYTGEYSSSGAWPLDDPCLVESWNRTADGEKTCTCEPSFDPGFDGQLPPFLSVSSDKESDGSTTLSLLLGGDTVWSGNYSHSGPRGKTSSIDRGSGCRWPEDECPCSEYETTKLNSADFRISLGRPAAGRISGFLWLSTDEPLEVSPASFRLMARSDAAVTDETASDGVRRIVCGDERGKTLEMSAVYGGVAIVVRDTASGSLDHTWRVVNENGDTSCIRFVKTSRLDNTMSDETYRLDSMGAWTRTDNVSGLVESFWKSDNLNMDGQRTLVELRRSEADGMVLSETETTYSIIGSEGMARLRETERRELSHSDQWKVSTATWWDDPAHPGRHALAKLVRRAGEPWEYSAYDEDGRRTLRLRQLSGSSCAPLEGASPQTLAEVPAGLVCEAVESSYAVLPGDDEADGDKEEPRAESRWILGGAQPILASRTWRVFTRGTHNGLATRIVRTERASSPLAAFGDAGNAVSETVSYADDGAGTPPLLRGAEISRLREDGIREETAWTLVGDVLRSEKRVFAGETGAKTAHVEERDATHGVVTYTAERLAANGVEFGWERRKYDDQNRLRSVTYSDGSSSTNVYSCCRLLSSTDRTGFTTLRSATTGTDRLYYAEEEISFRDLPRFSEIQSLPPYEPFSKHGHRVTQHFMDAMGRETNTVVCGSVTPGQAVDPSFYYRNCWHCNETAAYPDGVSDHIVSVDRRGLVTERIETVFDDRVETVVREFPTATSATPDVVSTNISYLGGGAVSFRTTATNWTERTSFTEWDVNGLRSEVETTSTSDGAFFTNRVVRYDFLGRVAEEETPLSRVVSTYDGASPRVASTLDERSGVGAVPLYDDFGDEIGEVRGGVETVTETDYAELSNAWWRVVVTTVSHDDTTNSVSSFWTRLTGLSDEIRAQSFREEDGTCTFTSSSSFDADTAMATEHVWTPTDCDVVRRSRYGHVLEEEDRHGVDRRWFDSYGRVFMHTMVEPGGAERRQTRAYRDDIGDVYVECRHEGFTPSAVEWKYYSYDARGNCIGTEDHYGNEIDFVCDADGRIIEAGGDGVHPLQQGFDALGRRVSLSTTRDGGTWDETRWTFDAATGLPLEKTYADGSIVSNAYAADGLPLRTTQASGKWKENAYDALRRLASVTSSDGALDAGFEYDAFSRLSSAFNASSSIAYLRDGRGNATNETSTSDGMDFSIVRTYDAYGRIVGRAVAPRPPSGGTGTTGGSPVVEPDTTSFTYRPDGLLSSVSNSDAVISYFYDNHAQDIGYELTLSSGIAFCHVKQRNAYRRERIQSVSNACGEVTRVFSYGYDALDRPTSRTLTGTALPVASSFSYNSRGEVASAVIGDHDEAHEYDFAGNSITASCNSFTNEYVANSLNQYTSVGRRAPTPPPATMLTHDIDGNLTNCAPWSFTWDSGNRLTTVSSNGVQIAAYAYDCFGRRVKKTTAASTTHFFYDGWNLVREIEIIGVVTNVVEYVWGKDLSGTFQGAGGVGGLLYERRNGAIYIPYQDAFGNVMGYWDTNGVIVAEYTYDAFGRTISQFGPMAEVFRHRFSTKYYDSETGFYYYGYRHYFPELRRWLSRDPLEEEGGANLYAFSANSPIYNIDFLGGKIVVIKHIPGEEPLGGWSNSGALADTVYKSTSYITAEYKCAEGKIGFKVQIIEPVVMVHVYMTKKVDPLFLMHFENDHVHNAKRHDAAIWKYKYDLESVCVCPCEARRRQQELEQNLVDTTRKIKADNDALDSENGPHKIDWHPGVKR